MLRDAIVGSAVALFLALGFHQPAFCQSADNLKAQDAMIKERWDEAFNAANRAILVNARDAEAYSIRGKVHFKHERFEQARADFDTALKIQPGLADPALYQYRGQCNIERKVFPQAISDLRSAIRLYPNSEEYKLLGKVYCQQNKLEEAVQVFSKAIALDKKGFWAYKDRGDLYARLKKYPSALSDYSKFIEMNPTASIGYNARAQIYIKMGKQSLADGDLKQARKLEQGY